METTEKQLQDVLEFIANEIRGTIGISIIELQTGLALSSLSMQSGFDLEIAAAYNAEVVKQKMKAMDALNLKNQLITDFTISLTSQTHIINFISTKYILYFAYDSNVTSLAMVRVVLGKTVDKIKTIIETF